MRILFVCMGNICRSPTAEGVMRHLLAEEGLTEEIGVDSAGTGAWYAGSPPDRRATAAARGRGIVLEGTARQVTDEDFETFDLILCADAENVAALRAVAPSGAEDRIRLLRSFDPAGEGDLDVPTPTTGATAASRTSWTRWRPRAAASWWSCGDSQTDPPRLIGCPPVSHQH